MLRYGIRLSVSIATFFLGLALSFLPSMFSSEAPGRGDFKREILEVNREYLRAHINRDVATLDRLLADEFVVEGRSGGLTTKAQRLALLNDADYAFIDIDDRNTRVTATGNYGEVSGYAVLTSRSSGQESAGKHAYYYTRRFERRDGRWQLIGVQTYKSCGR